MRRVPLFLCHFCYAFFFAVALIQWFILNMSLECVYNVNKYKLGTYAHSCTKDSRYGQ